MKHFFTLLALSTTLLVTSACGQKTVEQPSTNSSPQAVLPSSAPSAPDKANASPAETAPSAQPSDGAASPQPSGSTSSEPVVYREPSGLFEISFPASYQVEETGSGVAFVSSDQGFAGSVDYGSAQGQSLTKEDMEAALKSEYEQRLKEVNWQGSEVQPDGSVRVDWTGTDPDGNQLDAISFVEQRGDTIYILNLFGVNHPYQTYNSDAEVIVNSYRVRRQ